MSALYPGPRPVRRARLPVGPHELVIQTARGFQRKVFLRCECTTRGVNVDVAISDDEMWNIWLNEINHDPSIPAPEGRTAPNAVYQQNER